MSLRQDYAGKSLKGFAQGVAAAIDATMVPTTSTGTTPSAGTLENVFIFSGTADNLTIGSIIPAPAAFTELTVGTQGGPSGPVTFWGNAAANYLSWDPASATLNIAGNLSVTNQIDLGNIRIFGNTIEAILPVPDGDINLIPQGNGQIAIQGNLTQTALGAVNFAQATSFQVTATSTSTVDSGTFNRSSVRNGDLLIATDFIGPTSTFSIVSVINYVPIANTVQVTTSTSHTFQIGDPVVISGSNSVPSIDGTYSITALINQTSVIISFAQAIVTAGTTAGTVTKKAVGNIYISAGKSVALSAQVPLQIGGTNRSQLIATAFDSLSINTDYLSIDDPIPTLTTPTGGYSDSGWQIQYTNSSNQRQTGFFGFQGSTQYFTWIPNATVIRNNDGTKTVSGTRGTIQLSSIVTNEIHGNPDLLLAAPRNIILQAGNSITTPTSIPIYLGTSVITPYGNGDLQIVTGGDVQMLPTTQGKGLVLSTGAPITLNGSNKTQQIIGTNTGISINSPSAINLTTPAGGNINIPADVYLTFGNTFQNIVGDTTGLMLTSINDIYLSPNITSGGVVRLQPYAKIVFGDTASYITGSGTNSTVTFHTNGPMNQTSTANITLNPLGGTLTSTGQYLSLPSTNTIQWGSNTTNSYLAVTPTLTVLSNLNASASININASNAINLNAAIINIPIDVPLTFGSLGTITQTSSGSFNVSSASTNPMVLTANNVIINGNLQVNGQMAYVQSTTTTFRDPVLHISLNPPLGDVTSKGFDAMYYDGPYQKLAAFWMNPVTKIWTIASDATNTNEILTANVLGTLNLGTLTAQNVSTSNFISNSITGTPDLYLNANGGSVYINPSKAVVVPTGIPLLSGGNTITASTVGWNIAGPNVTIVNGALTVGNSTFTMSDINNLHIGGGPNISIDALLNVQSTITFGNTQTKINIDNLQNLVLTSTNAIQLTTNTIMQGGMTMGNAFINWYTDVPGGRVIWQNTNATTPLYLSVMGSIYDAYWRGQPIGINYGGTGHLGGWTTGSVVFVDSSSNNTFLSENNASFFWNNSLGYLGIGTNTPSNALTIAGSAGNIDMAATSSSAILFRHNGLYAFSLDKNPTINMLAIKTTSIPTTSISILTSVFSISPYGNIGINQSDAFFSTLVGATSEAKLYVGGNQRFTDYTDQLQWSPTQYITSSSDGQLHVYTGATCTFHSSTMHIAQAQFYDSTSNIYGQSGGRLNITSTYATYMRSPHTVHTGRCCIWHDPITDVCDTFITMDNNVPQDVDFINTIGNINLSSTTTVHFVGQTTASFGNNNEGSIGAQQGNLYLTANTSIVLNASNSIQVPNSTPVVFNGITTLAQNVSNGQFELTSTTPIAFNAPSLFVPDNTPLVFGNTRRQIISDGVNLHVKGSDAVWIESNLVHISGDLIVDGTTTQRFFTETQMEAGIIQLGGGNLQTITGISSWSGTQTQITTAAAHGLQVGDQVTLANTDPNIDGTYQVTLVPTATTFIIPLVTPIIPVNVQVQGQVRSLLVVNPNHDVGIQANWHNGIQQGTLGARASFFVMQRSTQRFTYFVTGQNQNGIVVGQLGDGQFNALYMNNLSAANLIAPLNAGGYTITGSSFVIQGGSIDNTPIGATIPSTGVFTNLHVTGTLQIDSTIPVTNLNADMVDGKHASDLVWRDGSQQLTNNWNAGPYQITLGNLASTSLNPTSVVFAGQNGLLVTDTQLTYNSSTQTLGVPNMAGFTLAGNINGKNNYILNTNFANGTINYSNITIPQGNTFDASIGTVVFQTGQLSGNWVAGGTAQCNISGNAATVTNGVYSTEFTDNSILKADVANAPIALTVPENTLVGRITGGVITALDAPTVRNMLNVAEKGTTDVYSSGALMRMGNLFAPDAGTMIGAFGFSVEHVQMQSDQIITLDTSKNVSFVYVSASIGSTVAVLTLSAGMVGMIKWIIIDTVPSGTIVNIQGNLIVPGATVSGTGLWTDQSATSTMLIWNDLTSSWRIAMTGMLPFDPRSPPNP